MNTKQCKHCNEVFNLDSIAKKAAGGKINECPDCVEELGTETAVKYTGIQIEETGSFAISRHATEEDRQKHMKDLMKMDDLSK
jgi:NAD-dependent SIR2 family protein deacetylase